jgi:protein ImuB
MSGAPPPTHRSKPSRAYACLYFPEWSIDVTRRKLSAQHSSRLADYILLTADLGQHTVVRRACRKSIRSGVRPRMTSQLARALLPAQGVYCETFDALRDVTALHTLASWCLRFSPYVGLDSELHNARLKNEEDSVSSLHYGIALDLCGMHKIYGNFNELAHSLQRAFSHAARIAIAPSIGAAWALSRYAPYPAPMSPIIASSMPCALEQTHNLPVAALRITQDSILTLHEVGISTIGQLLEVPRHMIATRFGKHIIYRLSQLHGCVEEQVHCITPRQHFSQQKIFEPPLTHRRAITQAITGLFKALLSSLTHARMAASLFSLTLRDTSGIVIRKELPLASASHDPEHLTAIIHPIIESIRFCGELREILIEVPQTARVMSSQQRFSARPEYSVEAQQRAHKELLNTFCVRIGKDRISYARLSSASTPERSFSYESALATTRAPEDALFVGEHASIYGPLERPPVLFSRPEPITTIAMLPDRPPSRLTWRGVSLTIRAGIGPERISPEWWRGDLQRDTFSERDYFTVQDDSGRWLWVYRDSASQGWFVHGVWI